MNISKRIDDLPVELRSMFTCLKLSQIKFAVERGSFALISGFEPGRHNFASLKAQAELVDHLRRGGYYNYPVRVLADGVMIRGIIIFSALKKTAADFAYQIGSSRFIWGEKGKWWWCGLEERAGSELRFLGFDEEMVDYYHYHLQGLELAKVLKSIAKLTFSIERKQKAGCDPKEVEQLVRTLKGYRKKAEKLGGSLANSRFASAQ